ncbi:hypothetical protein L6164_004987 [Bauhinia variegata]|uniref:Uncharacterized protein n=1 Tax=Bauhinia variegata TaxID=167791 RepID=A0ACB9PVC0_BAUVA|nr:hypothetical protein L6164_004987 [Bauhinia variegata]
MKAKAFGGRTVLDIGVGVEERLRGVVIFAEGAKRDHIDEFLTLILEQSYWTKNHSFLGPTLNWSLPIAAAVDTKKPPEMISPNMTAVMCVYSAMFMRFAWVVQPRNLHLLVCHVSNETVQLYQLSRWIRAKMNPEQKNEEDKQ